MAKKGTKNSGLPKGKKTDKSDKTNPSEDLLETFMKSFSFLSTIVEKLSEDIKKNNTEQKKINKEQSKKLDKNNEKQNKKLELIEKNTKSLDELKNNLQELNKSNNAIIDQLKLGNELNEVASEKAEFSEEITAEKEKEKLLAQEKAAEENKEELAKIISKLETLDNTMSNIGGESSSSGGLLGLLGSLLTGALTIGSALIAPLISAVFGTLGLMITPLVAALGPLAAALITTVLGGAAGFALFKFIVEPWMDEQLNKAQEATEPKTTGGIFKSEQVVTDKGEKVYEKENASTGEISYVTESQREQELKSMPEEERKKVESGQGSISYREATNTIDTTSKMYTGQVLPSGVGIDKINVAAKEQQNAFKFVPDPNKTPAQNETEKQRLERSKEISKYAREIAQFDESFRDKIAFLMTQWGMMDLGERTSITYSGGKANYVLALENIQRDHLSLINRINNSKILTDADKEQLRQMSFLFDKGIKTESNSSSYLPIIKAEGEPVLGVPGSHHSYQYSVGENNYLDLFKLTYPNEQQSYDLNREFIDKYMGVQSTRIKSLREKFDASKAKIQEKENDQTSLQGSLIDQAKAGFENLSKQFPKVFEEKIKEQDIPSLEKGGVVHATSKEGALVNISENFKTEAVVPLDEYLITQKDSIQPINISEKMTNIMRDYYLKEKDLTKNNPPMIINNITESKTPGPTPMNYQYQTSLAKTFDTVFDDILRKNLTLSVVT